jgi:hypothetical protein
MQGDAAAGVAHIRQGLAALPGVGPEPLRPYWLALLAEAYSAAGQPEPGLVVLDEACTLVATTEVRWWEAELSRLKGVLLLRLPSPEVPQAEACFQQALEVARRQQAKALELRTALSLARLRHDPAACHLPIRRTQLAQCFFRDRKGEIPDKDIPRGLSELGCMREGAAATDRPRCTRCSSPYRRLPRHMAAPLPTQQGSHLGGREACGVLPQQRHNTLTPLTPRILSSLHRTRGWGAARGQAPPGGHGERLATTSRAGSL